MHVSKFVYRVENTVNQICLCYCIFFVKNVLKNNILEKDTCIFFVKNDLKNNILKKYTLYFGYIVWNTQWNPNNNVFIL